jgi:hypothetical protein
VNTTDAIEGSIESQRSVELLRDEDLLTKDLQRELEAVGSAVGVIAVLALFVAALPRARRLLELTPLAKEKRHG